jgi:phosphoribosylformimino-5-aminoimidazole carboxamide ribotide isomerase
LFPAIDLKDGACVRLKLGDMAAATVFNDNPAAQAKSFEAQGVSLSAHRLSQRRICRATGECAGGRRDLSGVRDAEPAGGGIRDRGTVGMWLDKGVRRVILGTVAVRDPDLVKRACRMYPGRVVVGIDAKAGKVLTEGRVETSEVTVVELARRVEDAGVAAIIYTDIDRDGILAGLNLPATLALAKATSITIIASGGLASMTDIDALAQPEFSVLQGAIFGRALYDGRIDPAVALAKLEPPRPDTLAEYAFTHNSRIHRLG